MSEWFLPTDLAPVAGGAYRVFPPPGLAGFTAPFDVDVLEVTAPTRLLLRWHGEQLHTEVVWELTSIDGGCRLRVAQSGFLGLQGERRRAELMEAYELLFQERLPALLARLALDDVLPPPPVRIPLKLPAVEKPGWWRRIADMPAHRRLRLLSVLGAMILTVLVTTALATLVLNPPEAPAGAPSSGRPPGQAFQPGISATEVAAPPPPPPSSAPTRSSLSAGFSVSESYEGGYIAAITVRAGAEAVSGWTAEIELPPGAQVTSAWDRTSFRRTGKRVVFTPEEPHRQIPSNGQFTFFFQVGSAERPLTCSVNGVPCAGLSS